MPILCFTLSPKRANLRDTKDYWTIDPVTGGLVCRNPGNWNVLVQSKYNYACNINRVDDGSHQWSRCSS